MSYWFNSKTSAQNLEDIAITERLDEFLEIEDSSPAFARTTTSLASLS